MQAVEFFSLKNNCICLQNFAHISGIHGSLKADPSTPNFENPNIKNKTELNFLNPLK